MPRGNRVRGSSTPGHTRATSAVARRLERPARGDRRSRTPWGRQREASTARAIASSAGATITRPAAPLTGSVRGPGHPAPCAPGGMSQLGATLREHALSLDWGKDCRGAPPGDPPLAFLRTPVTGPHEASRAHAGDATPDRAKATNCRVFLPGTACVRPFVIAVRPLQTWGSKAGASLRTGSRMVLIRFAYDVIDVN